MMTRRLIIALLILIPALDACNGHEERPVPHTDDTLQALNAGYSILHTTLRDEQHLKAIRITKRIVTFKSIGESTRQIVDDIAETSSAALEELEQLSSLSPEIHLDSEENGQIEQMTRDAIRITTAKEFLTSKEDFVLILLVSQTQSLRFISHLAKELQLLETNTRRKVWLGKLSEEYEKLYHRVLSRLKAS
ncbi:MAG: hypothetical protein PVJ15_00665 [Gammaproteobacteria bacterium]|jgi:hypothetical protein